MLDRTVSRIEELALDDGAGKAGRLPSERALVACLQVSRATVREAIRVLTGRGLLDVRRGSGVYIIQKDAANSPVDWLQILAVHRPPRAETLEFRAVFECAAVRFAAQRASVAELQVLAALIMRMQQAVRDRDVDVEAQLDCEFHAALTSAAHNRMMGRFHASVISVLHAHIAANTFEATVDNANAKAQSFIRMSQHEAILAAILRRDPDLAQQAMADHIRFVGSQFDDSLD